MSQDVLGYPDTVATAASVPGLSGPICPGMSLDVMGYPDTVATAPESHVQVVLSVLGCPRMSWDIQTQWLQPLSPTSKWSYLSWDVLGYPDTVATAPESQVQVVLSVLGCPRMYWDIPTQWLQPLSPRSKWSNLSWDVPGCPGISRHSGYSP